jgi:hypothetical protein
MSEARKPLWPWIAALLIGLPVLYVVSIGPACWLFDHGWMPDWSRRPAWHFYKPLIACGKRSHPLSPALRCWCGVGSRLGVTTLMLFDPAIEHLPDPVLPYPPDWERLRR